MNMENPEKPIETLEAVASRLFMDAWICIHEHGFNKEAQQIVFTWKIAAEAYTNEAGDLDKPERARRQIVMNFGLAELHELAYGSEAALDEVLMTMDMSTFEGHPDLLEQYHQKRAALEAKIAESGK